MKNLELILSIIASLLAIISTFKSWKNSREITRLKVINSIKGNNNSLTLSQVFRVTNVEF